MSETLSSLVFRCVFSLLLLVNAVPAIAQHDASRSSSDTEKRAEQSLLGRYRSIGLTKILSFSGQDFKLVKGDTFEVIDAVTSCGNANKAGKPPCAWGELIKVKTSQNSALKDQCFCTGPNNILAQEKIPFEEAGVKVVQAPSKPDPLPAKSPAYLDKLVKILNTNACNKKSIVPELSHRYNACLARQKARGQKQDICACSVLRCAQFAKKALAEAGLVKSVDDLPGHANDPRIKKGLINNGFVLCSAIKSAERAPVGAVVIYHAHQVIGSDAGSPYGHMEVKVPGGYISDFKIASARTSYGKMVTVRGKRVFNRYVAGVYVKPPVSCK